MEIVKFPSRSPYPLTFVILEEGEKMPTTVKKGDELYEILLKAAKSDSFSCLGVTWSRIPDNDSYIFVQEPKRNSMDAAYSLTWRK